ncbi:MAG: isoprenylcysteine carboxylmethyltransferase family protein [Burkholderiales bacterium]|nr:isoprenylcysteine carboxylmethyltransferase family protein [Burkholderiales bacterium]
MKFLETAVPPPVVALACAGAMWAVALALPDLVVPVPWRRVAAMVLLAAGATIDAAGLLAFLRARTTVNPLRPANTSAMVTTGIYRVTRNPMYLGLVLILSAWAMWLAHPLAALGVAVFAVYIDRFQIRPEERILAAKFGGEFESYRRSVPRWL